MRSICQIFFIGCCGILFSGGVRAQFQLNGVATQFGTGCYRLTPAQNYQTGSIWNLTQINLNNSFELVFDIFLGCSNNPGADGIVFGLQPVSTLVGSTGQGIGFGGLAPSIGVEFDTHLNVPLGDPVFDHVAIVRNGDLNHNNPTSNLAGPVQCSPTNANVEDCAYHNVRVTWDAPTKTMQVFFDCSLRLTMTNDIVANTFNGNPVVYWGFTSATGGEVNEHRVCPKYYSFNAPYPDQTICTGQSATLQAPVTGAQSYTWSPTAGLNNPNIANPLATPSTTTSYIVTSVLECNQTVQDTITVFVSQFGNAGIDQSDLTICAGSSVTLTTTAPAGATYQWSTGAPTPTLTVNAAGTYTVTITDGTCTATDQVTISLLPPPDSFLPPDLTLCQGDTLTIPLPTGAAGLDISLNGQQITGSIVITETGNYTLTMTVPNSNCSTTDDLNVVFNAVPVVNMANAAICQGQAATLNATYPGATYLWSTGAIEPVLQVSTPGVYTVTITMSDCTYETSATVAIQELPLVVFPEDTLICLGGYIDLVVIGSGVTAVWQDGSVGMSYKVTEAGIYGVVAQNGCGTVMDNIVVNTEDCLRLYIPDCFSPNGDGVNDTFGPGFSTNVAIINRMAIFDRWGNLVFENTNFVPGQPPVEWNGSYKDKLVPVGTYMYMIEATFREGSKRMFSGDVTLVR